MTSLSDYYLGLTPAMIPTFEKYLQPSPVLERHLVEDTLCLAPQLAEDMSLSSFFELLQHKSAITSRVEVKFTSDQLKAIRSAAEREATNKISTSDALVAYLITVLNRISPVTIKNVTNIVNVRLPGCFPLLPNHSDCLNSIEE
jgi:hypothetical protein